MISHVLPCHMDPPLHRYLVHIPIGVRGTRQPAKKPNSAPYRSTNFSTSSIESGGVYDDWRDRVNKFNVNTAATHSHNGKFQSAHSSDEF